MNFKVCEQCGFQAAESEIFCRRCGHRLSDPTARKAPPNQTTVMGSITPPPGYAPGRQTNLPPPGAASPQPPAPPVPPQSAAPPPARQPAAMPPPPPPRAATPPQGNYPAALPPPNYPAPPPANYPAPPQNVAPPAYGTPPAPPNYGAPPAPSAPPNYGAPPQDMPNYNAPPIYGAPPAPFANPYAGQEGVWQDGATLVMRKDAQLPDRCVKCNDFTNGYKLKRNLSWHHPAVFLAIFFSPLIYFIVAMIVRKTATVHFGLCEPHRTKRRTGFIISWVLFGLSIACFVLAIAAENAGIILLSLLFFLAAIIYVAIVARVVAVMKIDEHYVWLKGLPQEYLSQFPSMRT